MRTNELCEPKRRSGGGDGGDGKQTKRGYKAHAAIITNCIIKPSSEKKLKSNYYYS